MAKDKIIEITGGISEWNISKDYVKYMLDQVGAGPVIIQMSSLGGDMNQALQIKKFIADRGDVTIQYFGFNASSSTIIGHGAAKTQIYEDSMYLVHKPSVTVDPTWGSLNADQIQAAIDNLISKQRDAEASTLIVAQEYVMNRGMEMSKVMELITAGNWITAKQAVEFGLVDEVIPATSKKSTISNEVMAMMTAGGYTVPVAVVEVIDETQKEENLIQKIINIISPKNSIKMHKDFSFLNQVLAVEGVEVAENKVTMTLEQLTSINNEFKAKTEAITTLTAEKETAVTAQATAETALVEATTKIDAIDVTVKAATTVEAKVAAITAKLAARPAVTAEKPQGKSGENDTPTDTTDWDAINALPHNQAADKSI